MLCLISEYPRRIPVLGNRTIIHVCKDVMYLSTPIERSGRISSKLITMVTSGEANGGDSDGQRDA